VARSTCVRCGNQRFEVVENEPDKARFKLMFVQCAKCGSVVGVTEYFNIGSLLNRMAEKLGVAP
jgi:uncharacterized Zn finger protein